MTMHRRRMMAIPSLMLLMLSADATVSQADSPMKEETLEAKVEQRLRMEGRIRWDELKVKSDGGQVTLYGIVKSNEERGFAEKAASTVPGVGAVVNKLIVEPAMPDSGEAPNARIKEDSGNSVLQGPSGLKDRQILP